MTPRDAQDGDGGDSSELLQEPFPSVGYAHVSVSRDLHATNVPSVPLVVDGDFVAKTIEYAHRRRHLRRRRQRSDRLRRHRPDHLKRRHHRRRHHRRRRRFRRYH